MKEKTDIVPTFENRKVQTGTKIATTYIADDGKEFKNKYECERYEKDLRITKAAEGLIQEIEMEERQKIAIVYLLTEGNEVSNINLFRWKVTKNKDIVEKLMEFFNLKTGSGLSFSTLEQFNESEEVLIISWTEYEHSDYPHNEYEIINYQEAIKALNDFSSKFINS